MIAEGGTTHEVDVGRERSGDRPAAKKNFDSASAWEAHREELERAADPDKERKKLLRRRKLEDPAYRERVLEGGRARARRRYYSMTPEQRKEFNRRNYERTKERARRKAWTEETEVSDRADKPWEHARHSKQSSERQTSDPAGRSDNDFVSAWEAYERDLGQLSALERAGERKSGLEVQESGGKAETLSLPVYEHPGPSVAWGGEGDRLGAEWEGHDEENILDCFAEADQLGLSVSLRGESDDRAGASCAHSDEEPNSGKSDRLEYPEEDGHLELLMSNKPSDGGAGGGEFCSSDRKKRNQKLRERAREERRKEEKKLNEREDQECRKELSDRGTADAQVIPQAALLLPPGEPRQAFLRCLRKKALPANERRRLYRKKKMKNPAYGERILEEERASHKPRHESMTAEVRREFTRPNRESARKRAKGKAREASCGATIESRRGQEGSERVENGEKVEGEGGERTPKLCIMNAEESGVSDVEVEEEEEEEDAQANILDEHSDKEPETIHEETRSPREWREQLGWLPSGETSGDASVDAQGASQAAASAPPACFLGSGSAWEIYLAAADSEQEMLRRKRERKRAMDKARMKRWLEGLSEEQREERTRKKREQAMKRREQAKKKRVDAKSDGSENNVHCNIREEEHGEAEAYLQRLGDRHEGSNEIDEEMSGDGIADAEGTCRAAEREDFLAAAAKEVQQVRRKRERDRERLQDPEYREQQWERSRVGMKRWWRNLSDEQKKEHSRIRRERAGRKCEAEQRSREGREVKNEGSAAALENAVADAVGSSNEKNTKPKNKEEEVAKAYLLGLGEREAARKERSKVLRKLRESDPERRAKILEQARARSRRRYHSMTPEQRKEFNRKQRWKARAKASENAGTEETDGNNIDGSKTGDGGNAAVGPLREVREKVEDNGTTTAKNESSPRAREAYREWLNKAAVAAERDCLPWLSKRVGASNDRERIWMERKRDQEKSLELNERKSKKRKKEKNGESRKKAEEKQQRAKQKEELEASVKSRISKALEDIKRTSSRQECGTEAMGTELATPQEEEGNARSKDSEPRFPEKQDFAQEVRLEDGGIQASVTVALQTTPQGLFQSRTGGGFPQPDPKRRDKWSALVNATLAVRTTGPQGAVGSETAIDVDRLEHEMVFEETPGPVWI